MIIMGKYRQNGRTKPDKKGGDWKNLLTTGQELSDK